MTDGSVGFCGKVFLFQKLEGIPQVFSATVEKSHDSLISVWSYCMWSDLSFWMFSIILSLSLMLWNFTMMCLEVNFFFHYLCSIIWEYYNLETLSFNSRKILWNYFFDNFLSRTPTTSPGFTFFFFLKIFFNWRIIPLQYCVGFCQTMWTIFKVCI